ncbi:unnamed protein product [Rangifer tarandus platyrhynchus]|uniref:Uncharacterized protein n=1 Tax=Rangifer tarandus platyrhynchus TaxID=3082113 RepID=A0ABN8YZF0_RANTA|nr:unnamed protein product [Rangifer tarandus platyrhynchus]
MREGNAGRPPRGSHGAFGVALHSSGGHGLGRRRTADPPTAGCRRANLGPACEHGLLQLRGLAASLALGPALLSSPSVPASPASWRAGWAGPRAAPAMALSVPDSDTVWREKAMAAGRVCVVGRALIFPWAEHTPSNALSSRKSWERGGTKALSAVPPKSVDFMACAVDCNWEHGLSPQGAGDHGPLGHVSDHQGLEMLADVLAAPWGRPGAVGGGWSDSTAPPGAWARCPSLVSVPRPPPRATLPPVDAPSQPAFPFPHPRQSGVPGTRSFPARPWPCALPRLEGTPRLGPGSRPSSSRGPDRAGLREGRRGLASVARAAGGNTHTARRLAPAPPRLRPSPSKRGRTRAQVQPHAACSHGRCAHPGDLEPPRTPAPASVSPLAPPPWDRRWAAPAESGPTPAPAGSQSGPAVRGLCPRAGWGRGRGFLEEPPPPPPLSSRRSCPAPGRGQRGGACRGGAAGTGAGRRRRAGAGDATAPRRGQRAAGAVAAASALPGATSLGALARRTGRRRTARPQVPGGGRAGARGGPGAGLPLRAAADGEGPGGACAGPRGAG